MPPTLAGVSLQPMLAVAAELAGVCVRAPPGVAAARGVAPLLGAQFEPPTGRPVVAMLAGVSLQPVLAVAEELAGVTLPAGVAEKRETVPATGTFAVGAGVGAAASIAPVRPPEDPEAETPDAGDPRAGDLT